MELIVFTSSGRGGVRNWLYWSYPNPLPFRVRVLRCGYPEVIRCRFGVGDVGWRLCERYSSRAISQRYSPSIKHIHRAVIHAL